MKATIVFSLLAAVCILGGCADNNNCAPNSNCGACAPCQNCQPTNSGSGY